MLSNVEQYLNCDHYSILRIAILLMILNPQNRNLRDDDDDNSDNVDDDYDNPDYDYDFDDHCEKDDDGNKLETQT